MQLQSTGRCGPLPSYSCDEDVTFVKLFHTGWKCNWESQFAMRPFVELHGLFRGLANPNPNVNPNPKTKYRPKHGPKHRPCFDTAVYWAMRTFAKLQLWWGCDLCQIISHRLKNATEKVNLRCGLLLNYSCDNNSTVCTITFDRHWPWVTKWPTGWQTDRPRYWSALQLSLIHISEPTRPY